MTTFIKSLTTKDFIEKSIKIHGTIYDYSLVDYINCYTKIKIICQKHGIFEQRPDKHLQKRGCYFCGREKTLKSRRLTTEIFIEKSKNVHGEKYDYSLVDYKNGRQTVKIICQKHGIFEQIARNHISLKQGCPKCKTDNLRIRNTIGWKTFYKDKICIIYLLRCYNETEDFIKIGVTSQSVKQRYLYKPHMPYEYEVLYEMEGSSEIISKIEQNSLRIYKKYNPFLKFSGDSECISIEEINDVYNDLSKCNNGN